MSFIVDLAVSCSLHKVLFYHSVILGQNNFVVGQSREIAVAAPIMGVVKKKSPSKFGVNYQCNLVVDITN